jgi:hypothetical protein
VRPYPHSLCVEPNPGGEPEAPPVDAADRDSERLACGDALGGCDGIARQSERARQDVRASAGDEPDGRVGPYPVQHLVEGAVTGKDVDGLGVSGRLGELGRMTRMLRPHNLHVAQCAAYLLGPSVADIACERVDDEEPHRSEA